MKGTLTMAEQLWKGRFSKAVESRVNDFNSSIRFDQRMIAQDMRGSGQQDASGSEADAGSRNPELASEARLRGLETAKPPQGKKLPRRCRQQYAGD